TRPTSLPRKGAAPTPADRRVIPDGLEPSLLGCEPRVVAAGPRDHEAVLTGVEPVLLLRQSSVQCRYTKAPEAVSDQGERRTPTRGGRGPLKPACLPVPPLGRTSPGSRSRTWGLRL